MGVFYKYIKKLQQKIKKESRLGRINDALADKRYSPVKILPSRTYKASFMAQMFVGIQSKLWTIKLSFYKTIVNKDNKYD